MEHYAILIILFLMAVCLLILTVIGYWGVFCKAGEKGLSKDEPERAQCLSYQMALPLFVRSSICNIKSRCTFRDAAAYTTKYSICTDSNALSPSKQSI